MQQQDLQATKLTLIYWQLYWKGGYEFSVVQNLTRKMAYLTTAPVEFRSLAICGIEGVNVPTKESSHRWYIDNKWNAKPIQKTDNEHTVYHVTSWYYNQYDILSGWRESKVNIIEWVVLRIILGKQGSSIFRGHEQLMKTAEY